MVYLYSTIKMMHGPINIRFKNIIFIGPQIRKLMQDIQFDEDLNKTERNAWLSFKGICKNLFRKSQISELVHFIKSYGMQYESENPLSGVTLGFFARKSRRSQWRTRWKISPRYYGHGKAVLKQVDLRYVGRLLLDTEEVCTWGQISAKIVSLYILEETFCMFHEYVK